MNLMKMQESDQREWYKITLYRLIEVCKKTASKYTRSKVHKALPEDFAYVIEELITERPDIVDKESYDEQIIQTIIEIGRAEEFIVALAELIQRLVVDHLHILEIFMTGDRGRTRLWTVWNTIILWISSGEITIFSGWAAAGQACCVATVVRICARYANLDILEDGYGIIFCPWQPLPLLITNNYPAPVLKLRDIIR